eukprot:3537339-Amphidinium_carterae.1
MTDKRFQRGWFSSLENYQEASRRFLFCLPKLGHYVTVRLRMDSAGIALCLGEMDGVSFSRGASRP